MGKTKHDRISEQIANARRAKYNPDKGPDINTSKLAVEVEVDKNTLSEGMNQLKGFRKPVYLGVPDNLVKDAIERTKGTTVGVMNEKGNIMKPSTRRKK